MAKIRPGKPRFGLVGTGVWARTLHAPTAILAAAERSIDSGQRIRL